MVGADQQRHPGVVAGGDRLRGGHRQLGAAGDEQGLVAGAGVEQCFLGQATQARRSGGRASGAGHRAAGLLGEREARGLGGRTGLGGATSALHDRAAEQPAGRRGGHQRTHRPAAGRLAVDGGHHDSPVAQLQRLLDGVRDAAGVWVDADITVT